MKKKILISLSYLLVAMLATVATLAAIGYPGYASGTKLEQLESLILERFIGDADQTAMEDAAAAAMAVWSASPMNHSRIRLSSCSSLVPEAYPG